MKVASFSIQQQQPSDDTVTRGKDSSLEPAAPTVSFNRFSGLRFCRTEPITMAKRKVSDESSEDSLSSLDGASGSVDYSERGWASRSSSDWGRFSWAFGLEPSSSSGVRRRRRRRGAAAAARGGSSQADEEDPMKELLKIVLWNGEREIDFTEELEEEEADSDDEELEFFKRQALAREQTIRPRFAPIAPAAAAASAAGKREEGGEEGKTNRRSRDFSMSNLRFGSRLKIGSSVESSKKSSVLRLEQRTNTMERAFKGVLEDVYISETSSSTRVTMTSEVTKTASSSTIVAGGEAGDEENFWDDVEF